MGKKNRHSKDRLYITAYEWSTEYGGKKNTSSNLGSRPLPFDHCALSLSLFETPCCTSDGVIFDLTNLVPYLRKHKCNPITGEPMASQDIIRLNMHKDAEGHWHCPITCKVFNNNTHIVAIKTTGNVFSYDAVNELNIKQKNYLDLLTSEPFTKNDIITLQDPSNAVHMAKRDINNFIHLKKVREDHVEATQSESKIRSNPISDQVMRELEIRKVTDVESRKKKRLLEQVFQESEYIDDVRELLLLKAPINAVNVGQVSTTGQASSSFTSSTMSHDSSSAIRLASAEELRQARWRKLRQLDKKGYVQLQTSHGNLNIELYCNWAQRSCWNFIELCNRGYYDDILFHRLVPGFMIQTGDPTGTGAGGESAWGVARRGGAEEKDSDDEDDEDDKKVFKQSRNLPFKDEFDSRLTHNARGIVSMANSGPNTNQSQFFITFAPTPHLDNKHTIFGKVVGGNITLDRMEGVEVEKNTEKPLEEIKLIKAIVFTNPILEADQLLIQDIQNQMKIIQEMDTMTSALPQRNISATTATTNTAVIGNTKQIAPSSSSLSSGTAVSNIGSSTNNSKSITSTAIRTSTTSHNNSNNDDDIEKFLKSQNQRLDNNNTTTSKLLASNNQASGPSSNNTSSTSMMNKKAKSEFGNFSGW